MKILVAKFNRLYQNHPDLFPLFMQAYEDFLSDVYRWQEQAGIKFSCELTQVYNYEVFCDVTAVVAEFESEEDYMFYILKNNNQHKIATEVIPSPITGNGFMFAGWTTLNEAEIY